MAGQGILGGPLGQEQGIHVALIIVLGVARPAEGFTDEEDRALAFEAALAGLGRGLVDRDGIVAVHGEGEGPLRAQGHPPCHLAIWRRGERIAVGFSHHDEGEFLYRGEVEPLGEGAGGTAAIADPGHGHAPFGLLPEGQGHPGHDGDEGAEHGCGRDDAAFHRPEVIVVLAAAGGARSPPQILEEDLQRRHAADEHGAQVADQGGDHIAGAEGHGCGTGRGLLAQAAVDAAEGLPLAEELHQPLLCEAGEQHGLVKAQGGVAVHRVSIDPC